MAANNWRWRIIYYHFLCVRQYEKKKRRRIKIAIGLLARIAERHSSDSIGSTLNIQTFKQKQSQLSASSIIIIVFWNDFAGSSKWQCFFSFPCFDQFQLDFYIRQIIVVK